MLHRYVTVLRVFLLTVATAVVVLLILAMITLALGGGPRP